MEKLLTPEEVDASLRWPLGKAERLARRGVLPHLVLPDGKTIRFERDAVERAIRRVPVSGERTIV